MKTKNSLENLTRDAFEHRVYSWNKNIFPYEDAVSDICCLIGKNMLEGQLSQDEKQKCCKTIKISVRNNKICIWSKNS